MGGSGSLVPYELHWFDPTHEGVQIDGYRLTETESANFNGEDSRRDFIQGPDGNDMREFYRHGRGISVAIVSACQLLIVEDDYTTKLLKLVKINLASLQRTALSEDAVEHYRSDTTASPDIFVNARAFAVSRGCDQALLAVELTSAGAATPEQAEAAGNRYPTRWYTVNLATGKVAQSYPSTKSPPDWH